MMTGPEKNWEIVWKGKGFSGSSVPIESGYVDIGSFAASEKYGSMGICTCLRHVRSESGQARETRVLLAGTMVTRMHMPAACAE